MIALIQAAFAVVWSIGAYMVSTARRAVAHWAAWAVLSCVTWLILSAKLQSPPLIGVVVGVVGVIALQRGIRLFIGREPTHRLHVVLLVGIIVAYWIGSSPERRYFQAAVNFGVLAWLYFDIARDLHAHARDQLQFRWPALLALPLLLGGIAYGARAVRAVMDPGLVMTQMAADSTLNVRAALIFVVLVVALHATLMVLVAGRLMSELRRLSRHDALTGLLNRRAMEEMLDAQVARSRRSGEPFVLMMLDLDHFKRINDQHGHAVGDLALKHVSALLGSAIGQADCLARFGGEEFVLLMPAAALSRGEPVAERLRELLSATPLTHAAQSVALSVSIGVAQWRGAGDELSQLLLRADAALFQAKVQGRNRVVLAAGGGLAVAVNDASAAPRGQMSQVL